VPNFKQAPFERSGLFLFLLCLKGTGLLPNRGCHPDKNQDNGTVRPERMGVRSVPNFKQAPFERSGLFLWTGNFSRQEDPEQGTKSKEQGLAAHRD